MADQQDVVDFPSGGGFFCTGILEADVAFCSAETAQVDGTRFDPSVASRRKLAGQSGPSGRGRVFAIVVVGEEHLKVIARKVHCRAEG